MFCIKKSLPVRLDWATPVSIKTSLQIAISLYGQNVLEHNHRTCCGIVVNTASSCQTIHMNWWSVWVCLSTNHCMSGVQCIKFVTRLSTGIYHAGMYAYYQVLCERANILTKSVLFWAQVNMVSRSHFSSQEEKRKLFVKNIRGRTVNVSSTRSHTFPSYVSSRRY